MGNYTQMFQIVPSSNLNDNQSLINSFLDSLDVRPSSKYTYRRQIKMFLLWISERNISNPSRHDILIYKEDMDKNKRLSSSTISGYLTAVRKLFEWLESCRMYPNVTSGIRCPKRRRAFKKDCLTVEQIKSLLQSINTITLTGMRDFAMLNLMIRTGLRTIEISRAKSEDVAHQSGAMVLFIHGKGRDEKDEIALLTESAIEPIQKYIRARGKVRDHDPLFASHSTQNRGGALTTRSISRIVKNRLKDIGIDNLRMSAHSLRHTAITLSLLAGATPQEACVMARHADINTTLIYAHNINRIEQAPELKIDKFLK